MPKSKLKKPADPAVCVLYEPQILLESSFREMNWLSVYLCNLWYTSTMYACIHCGKRAKSHSEFGHGKVRELGSDNFLLRPRSKISILKYKSG